MISVGEACAKNEIEVFHEHICTAFAERLLAAEILRFAPTEGNPTFLFALPPKEKHILGLLMAESVISETGANVCNLGADVPLTTIKNAALAINADVVCVSFSFSYPSREVVPVLRRLRSLLPACVQLWAGGSGIPFLTKSIKGVVINSDLNKTVEKVAAVPHNFTH
jgi:methylmalonyl-CoA mutase cobalamin-binding subunit